MRITIDAIKVNAAVRPVGVADDGSVPVPPLERADDTGWFERGPTPGETGPAIVVGHFDIRSGPAMCYRLGKLREGAPVEITRADRTVALFEVTSVERFDGQARPRPAHGSADSGLPE